MLIRNKIRDTSKLVNSKLSLSEKREKFGWLNKLSEEAQTTWKNEVMFTTGMHRWWKTATEDQVQLVIKKRIATMVGTIGSLIDASKMDPTNYAKYAQAAWAYTTWTYFKFKNEIDPNGIRSIEWHLDHKYSVKAGFINNVDPKIIGSKENLRIISRSENCTKNAKCSIKLEELIEATNGEV